jgi:PqqD family protein of HPr-rel-A system
VRWTAAPPADLCWVRWHDDDQYVLYHRPSGKTHIVNEATWLLLNQILRNPLDLTGTTHELARLRNLTPDEDLSAHVAGLLLSLEDLGLVLRA